MYIYRTYFKLVAPVIALEDARSYLSEDNMSVYLKEDSRLPKTLNGVIISIDWILRDEQSGYIELKTNKELNAKELEFISNWVSGQNSDGLGEGFEQQDFACYNAASYDGYGYDEDYEIDDEDWIMASFDWQTNKYKFELISSD